MSDSKTIDQQFIEYVVQSLVSKPEAVVVERTIDEKGVLLTLTVDPEDLGRVIGKRGATAQSLRTLLRALGTKQEARYNLKIVDNGEPKPERESRSSGDGWASSPSSSSDEGLKSEEPVAEDSSEDSTEESAVERTRRELEDLDDLDV